MASTYVYEKKEWVLTGRSAKKTIRHGKVRVLVEIRPVNADSSDNTYNQWVEQAELYSIIGDSND